MAYDRVGKEGSDMVWIDPVHRKRSGLDHLRLNDIMGGHFMMTSVPVASP